jgi:light-regulated signal transduction histidine kinase (bacteriophytochrome)
VELELGVQSVEGEPGAIREVITNLVDNAVEFSRGAGGTIRIGAQEEDATVTPWVTDAGIGFDMKHHDRTSQIFGRRHRPEDSDGAGVGLPSVRTVAARHGGRAGAASEGKGTTFYASLAGAGAEAL